MHHIPTIQPYEPSQHNCQFLCNFQGQNTKDNLILLVLITSNIVAKIIFSDITLSVVSVELVATIV